jgi:suppressor of ftsI
VRFDGAGETPLVNRVQALNHMYGTYAPETDTVARVLVDAALRASARPSPAFARLRRNDDVARAVAPYRRYFGRPVDRMLVLGLRVRDAPMPVALMLNGLNAPMDWNDGMAMANWVMTGREVTWILRDAATGRENMDVAWRFKVGEVIKLRLFNDPLAIHAMDHPIHIHGQRFLVLSRNGVSNPNLGWKDTAIIRVGETVDLLVDLSNPGRWMLHCHIAEHMGTGMMITLDVN